MGLSSNKGNQGSGKAVCAIRKKIPQSSQILSLPSQSVSSVSSNPVSLNVHGELGASEGTEPHQPYTSNHPLTDLDQPSTSGQQVINLDQPTTSSHQPINLDQPCTSGHPVIDLDQPSTSGYQQIDLDDPHDIEALQMMFPDRSIEYLRGIRGNNITLQETIDEILGKSEHIAFEGVYIHFKKYVENTS